MDSNPDQPQTIAEIQNTRGAAEPNEVAPVEETQPVAEHNPQVTTEEVLDTTVNIIEPDQPAIPVETPAEPQNPPQGTGQPPAPEDLPAPATAEPVKPPASPDSGQGGQADPAVMTIRSEETGDKVYAVRDGKRYWIKNPETLAKMGFYLGKEKRVPFSELLQYPEGEPVDLTVPGAVYPWDKPETAGPDPDKPSNLWS